jgi:hypothetical protein
MIKKVFTLFTALLVLGSMCITGLAYADNDKRSGLALETRLDGKVQAWIGDGEKSDEDRIRALNWSFDPALIGTVTAVSGSTLTVKAGENGATYSVDASDAVIRKGSSTTTLSTVVVGDVVMVQGAINGTSVVATNVTTAKSSSEIKKPIGDNLTGIIGSVTAIDGTKLTVKGKNNVTYTVSAGDAKVWKNRNNTSALANIKIGDSLIVQGTISGTAVTAKNIYIVRLPDFGDRVAISGTVTATSENTITLTGTNGTVYTILAADAKIKVDNKDNASLSDIKVGETITVTGTASGTTITASAITDGEIKGKGFFQRVGQFFKRIFFLR